MGRNTEDFDDTLLIDDADDDKEDKTEEGEAEDQAEQDQTNKDDADTDDQETEEAEESEEEEADASDKKVTKIIALKREIKDANKRIAELERAKAEITIEEEAAKAKKKMMDDGYSEADTERFVSLFKENAVLKQKQDQIEWDALAKKHPNILKYREEITEFRKTLPSASIEDVYLAKFSKVSAYDEKTRIEQELLYKKGLSDRKAGGNVTGGKSAPVITKLSPSDERAYSQAVKMNPTLTKAQFKKTLEEEELT